MTAWVFAALALATLFALALLAFVSEGRQRALCRRLEALESQLDLQGQSVSALIRSTEGVDRRIARLEAREQVLSERQDTFESQQAEERPYHQAIRLVRQGAGLRRLVEELELSESEADLIVRLHGERQNERLAEI